MKSFTDPGVAAVFDSYPPAIRHKLLAVRNLIYATAATTRGVGQLTETLKWGEPAYLTTQTKSGSTVRIGWKRAHPENYAVYFNCQTTLVDTFRAMFPPDFTFEGNRAIVLHLNRPLPMDELAWCLAAALTYHMRP